MKVGFVTGGFPPHVGGGAENYVIETASELKTRGHEAFVITTRPFSGLDSLTPTRERIEGLDVYRFFPLNVAHRSSYERYNVGFRSLWRLLDAPNPHAARVVGRLVERESPEVVHTNNLEGISTLATRAIQRTDARHVHTLHDYGLLCPNSTLRVEGSNYLTANRSLGNHPAVCAGFSRLQRALLGRPDFVTAPSQFALEAHRERGLFQRTPGERLRLGVRRVADEPGTPGDRPSVLYVGGMEGIKGVDTVLDTALSMPEFDFHFCGTGPYADTVDARARNADNVTYHGFVDDETLWNLRRSATMAVVPSVWPENSPLTIYESFAAGLPVVGSDVGGIPELVTPGETGALYEPGDPTNLAGAIERTASDDQRELRERCLAWAREHTLEVHVDRLIDRVYQD